MALHKILICDDSPTDLAKLRDVLDSTPWMAISATSGEEAIRKAKAEKPDAILLDIVMPGIDGFAACRALRDDPDTKNIPVIFVTTKQQKADLVWAQMQGAKGLIGKPYEAAEVLEQLQLL